MVIYLRQAVAESSPPTKPQRNAKRIMKKINMWYKIISLIFACCKKGLVLKLESQGYTKNQLK